MLMLTWCNMLPYVCWLSLETLRHYYSALSYADGIRSTEHTTPQWTVAPIHKGKEKSGRWGILI